jgi:hypothetical protein
MMGEIIADRAVLLGLTAIAGQIFQPNFQITRARRISMKQRPKNSPTQKFN